MHDRFRQPAMHSGKYRPGYISGRGLSVALLPPGGSQRNRGPLEAFIEPAERRGAHPARNELIYIQAQPTNIKRLALRTFKFPGSPASTERPVLIRGHSAYYRDGTTRRRSDMWVFEPMDFLARLATLVSKPRVNLTRFHRVFAASSRFRPEVTPGRRGQPSDPLEKFPADRRRAMNRAQRLKRVFGIDIEVCSDCGGRVKVLADTSDPRIEEQPVIDQILNRLNRKRTWLTPMSLIPEATGPPAAQLF